MQFPVAPMIARPVAELPRRGRHSYEIKWDGWRCVAVRGCSCSRARQQRSLTARFPGVVDAVAGQLPPGTVVDGELVAMRHGRVDFTALGSPDAPHWLVAFDVLAQDGQDVRPEPYWSRRDRLAQLVGDAATGVVLAPAVDDVDAAQAWLDRHAELGVEGVMSKKLNGGYRPHRLRWVKTRATYTGEAVIGGVIGPIDQPRALILGRFDRRGRLRIVGRTHRLHRAASAELGALLTPPQGVHPWPTVIPGGRLGLAGATDDVAHTPVQPSLVVELDIDAAVVMSTQVGSGPHCVIVTAPACHASG
ncbi:ATP dependent DNA ligase-like protein [Pseudonocardia autotrophica]|nr:ATP dependent DNA ligase-like protein [Pseudonocardia autotrophica]